MSAATYSRPPQPPELDLALEPLRRHDLARFLRLWRKRNIHRVRDGPASKRRRTMRPRLAVDPAYQRARVMRRYSQLQSHVLRPCALRAPGDYLHLPGAVSHRTPLHPALS